MDKLKIGIIGYGNMGAGHALSIVEGKCPRIELAAVADIAPGRLEAAKSELPDSVALFESGSQLIASGAVDAVLIAVPHYDHPTLAVEAFAAGLHVMCEKPAGVYTLQVRRMNEAAAQSGRVFGMMFNQRTNPVYRRMKEIVDSGELGAIRRTNWIITDWYRPQVYYDSGAWRATWSGEGGGVLLNQCPHNLDLWQWICGMPVRVSANLHYGKWHDIEVEDDVTAYVEYANGATGVFVTTTGDTPGTNRFEISFDKGKLVAENGKLFMWKNSVSEPEFSRTNTEPFARPEAVMTEVEITGEYEAHPGVLNAFAGAVIDGGDLIAQGEEGINGLTLSNAMHLSSWLEKPVDLPFDEQLFHELLSQRIASSRRKENVTPTVSVVKRS